MKTYYSKSLSKTVTIPEPATQTRNIAGHTITLEIGRRYLAFRPMASQWRGEYPVTVKEIKETEKDITVLTLDMNYSNANAFVNTFNNGPISFNGRIW